MNIEKNESININDYWNENGNEGYIYYSIK